MNAKAIESMTLQEIKDLYKTLTNAVPVVGTGKNGCKIKKDWIEAVQKSSVATEPEQTATEPEQIAIDTTTTEEPAPKKESQIKLTKDDMSEIRFATGYYVSGSKKVYEIVRKGRGLGELSEQLQELIHEIIDLEKGQWMPYGKYLIAEGVQHPRLRAQRVRASSCYVNLYFIEKKTNKDYRLFLNGCRIGTAFSPDYFRFSTLEEAKQRAYEEMDKHEKVMLRALDSLEQMRGIQQQPAPTEEPQPFTDWEEIPEHEQIPFYDPDYVPEDDDIPSESESDQEYRALPNTEKIKMPISFGWTLDRLLKGMKTVTRRQWTDSYAQIFINAYKQGKLVPAFDKDRRYGGKLIGWLELLCEPYKEPIYKMPEADIKNEGYPELSWLDFTKKFFPKIDPHQELWVIRFEFYPLENGQTKHTTSLNQAQVQTLQKYGFYYQGKASEGGFLEPEPKHLVNGWATLVSIDEMATPPHISDVSLMNFKKDEWWIKYSAFQLTMDKIENAKMVKARYIDEVNKVICELALNATNTLDFEEIKDLSVSEIMRLVDEGKVSKQMLESLKDKYFGFAIAVAAWESHNRN